MRALISVFCLILAGQSPAARGQDTTLTRRLTLQECENLAFQNHPEIKEAEIRIETARAKRTQASYARFVPQFEVRNVWGPVPKAEGFINEFGAVVSADTSTGVGDLRYFTEIELNLLQPIYTFGKLRGLNDAASHGVQVEMANLEKQKNAVRLKVRELYWGLVLGKELLTVIENAQEEADKADSKLQEKLDEGSEEVSQTDLFKLQIFQYEINKREREAKEKIQIARSALHTLLGFDETEYYDLDVEYLDPVDFELLDLESYMNMARAHRPEVAQLEAGLNASGALLRSVRSEYYPQFFFAGQVKYNFAKDRFDPNNPFIYNPTNFFRPGFVIGANMNLNFWQTRQKVRLAEIEYRKLSEKQDLLDDGLRLDVEKAYVAVQEAKANIDESRRALKASENWLRSASMTFDLGLGEIKDLIEAFKANSQMQGEHLQNIFAFNTAVAKLSQAVGQNLYEK